MKTLILKSVYTFYALPEDQRIAMIGKWFKEEGGKSLHFPLGLTVDEFNYGIQQGLVFVSSVMDFGGKKWFRVGVISPDDLDMDLDFGEDHCKLHNKVVQYVKTMPKQCQNIMYLTEGFCNRFRIILKLAK
jgi:hypothetical protein